MKLGILTSGGDCAGLNAVIRAIGLYVYDNIPGAEIVGIPDGYGGLIEGECFPMKRGDFGDSLLREGGTVLGTSRQPYKTIAAPDGNGSRLSRMCANYRKMGLDCLFTLGGAGTHKTAALLCSEGCNVIGLPKTIDNDIYGTDITFGFLTAVDIAAGAIKRIRTTADSHSRVFFVEVMGNKVGWLTLYAGLASGADAILIPEIAYDEDKLAQFIKDKKQNSRSVVIAVAEGVVSSREAAMSKKERKDYLAGFGTASAAERLSALMSQSTGMQCRSTVLGHIQRGGEPCAYDKFISTEIGAYGAHLAKVGRFGVTVCVRGNKLSYNMLVDIAGKTKRVPSDGQLVLLAKDLGIYFGE